MTRRRKRRQYRPHPVHAAPAPVVSGFSRTRNPRRRLVTFVGALLALGVVISAAFLYGPALRHPPLLSRPNVLLVTIDTLRWDHVGCYGSRNAATPVLDRLAASGARFETAIMHAPLTAPSHASILTGLTPLRHGVRDNGAFVLPTDVLSLPVVLQREGYTTAGFVSGFPVDRRFGFANGFTSYDDRLPRGATLGRESQTERRADQTSNRVLEWLSGTTTRPWFLWVHYFDPHAAYDPPPEYLKLFPDHPYDGEIAFVDAQIGRLFDRLKQLGQFTRTLVLVTADHGESLGDHGEQTHGVFVYDSTLRVPWIISGPGIHAGDVPEVVARGVDVMPTLLDLAGVTVPPAIDGRSLRPALDGRALADEPAYVESLLAKRHLGWAPIHGLRDARWKYIQVPGPELYDLSADAHETANRAPAERDRVATMARELQAQLSAARRQTTERRSDPETTARLRALGYISGTPADAEKGRPDHDPKDGIATINRIERAIAGLRSDPRTAATELRAVLAVEPASALARRQLAVALSALNDHDGVISEIHTLQSENTATPEDLLLLSESLRIRGRAEEASAAVNEAAFLDPRSPDPPLTRARALMSALRPDEAAAAYKAALDVAPDHPEALTGLANIALSRGETVTAEGFFRRVLARDPADVTARTGLGLVRGRQGRMSEAIDVLQQVVRDAPTDAEALAGLGAALARTGAPSAAIPYFERAFAAGLRTPALLTGLGFARLETGDRPGALSALRASLALRPDQPGVQQAIRDLTGTSADPRGRR
jgi:choline-sulfatase